jgi:FkbM family methyltransferase
VISYAQNAEDVVLARALPAAAGFYVDVGAGHPEISSVTKHFYDLGWSGINIEPRADAIALLDEQRPRDVNLQVAVGAFEGTTDLYVVDGDPDLSTIDDADVEFLRERGYEFAVEKVPVRTLDSLLEEHNVTTIDFLKIDVEGSEGDVLAGVDLSRWRPRVIVIESIKPWSRERSDASWRTILESQHYRERCFDGVNLFFAHEDDSALVDALVPASVLDEYQPASVVALEEGIDELRTYVAKLEDELVRHRELAEEVSDYVASLESELQPEGGVAPVIELGRSLRDRLPSTVRPPAPARLALIGTPRSGSSWVRSLLAETLHAEQLPVMHPADLDWAALPNRFVVQLAWERTRFLEHALREQGIAVVSVARHPLDVLVNFCAGAHDDDNLDSWLEGREGGEQGLRGAQPGDTAFLEWALSPRARLLLSLTPQWWSSPTTHRLHHEDFLAQPEREFAALLEACELEPMSDPSQTLASNPPARLRTGGDHAWGGPGDLWRAALPAAAVDALMDAHREVIVALGYDPDDRTLG